MNLPERQPGYLEVKRQYITSLFLSGRCGARYVPQNIPNYLSVQPFIMSYPPPPGLKASQPPSSSSTPQPHASLPPRPPPPVGPPPSFKQALTSTPTFSSGAPGTRRYDGNSNDGGMQASNGFRGSFTAFQPRSIAANAQPFRTHSPVVSVGPAPPTGFSAPQTTYTNGAYQAQPSYQQPPTPSYYPKAQVEEQPYVEPTPPQIRNPFPLPGQDPTDSLGRGRGLGRGQEPLDPEMEAQIAQWQSAYAVKDSDPSRNNSRVFSKFGEGSSGGVGTGANSGPLGLRPDATGPAMSSSAITSAANSDTGLLP